MNGRKLMDKHLSWRWMSRTLKTQQRQSIISARLRENNGFPSSPSSWRLESEYLGVKDLAVLWNNLAERSLWKKKHNSYQTVVKANSNYQPEIRKVLRILREYLQGLSLIYIGALWGAKRNHFPTKTWIPTLRRKVLIKRNCISFCFLIKHK